MWLKALFQLFVKIPDEWSVPFFLACRQNIQLNFRNFFGASPSSLGYHVILFAPVSNSPVNPETNLP
jgi:hypothetical protein